MAALPRPRPLPAQGAHHSGRRWRRFDDRAGTARGSLGRLGILQTVAGQDADDRGIGRDPPRRGQLANTRQAGAEAGSQKIPWRVARSR